jgi:erythromycin esterase
MRFVVVLTWMLGGCAARLPAGVHTQWSPLAEIVGDADLLGVGESIHASAGLEAARAEVMGFAVDELGFRVVAAELSWVEGRRVDDDLVACGRGLRGDVRLPTSSTLWDGLDAPLQRLCARNAAHPDELVRFVGFDLQDSWHHRRIVEEAVGDGPDEGLRQCFGAWVDSGAELAAWGREHGHPPPTEAAHRACLSRVEALRGEQADPTVRLALDSLAATQHTNLALLAHRDVSAAYEVREAAMLEVLKTELERVGGGRAVLLGHDHHVGRSAPAYEPLGARLSAEPGVTYRAVAVGGAEVHSRLGGGVTQPPPERGSVQARWARLRPKWVLVDLRGQEGAAHDAQVYVDVSPAE